MPDEPDQVHVTAHAAQRYIERVNGRLTPIEAVTAIRKHSRVLRIAMAFGCSRVILGNRARLVLVDGEVGTVLPPHSRGEARL